MTNTNDNWDKCPACGAPVMVDPQTSEREDCGQCASRQSSTPGWLGFWFILLLILMQQEVCLEWGRLRGKHYRGESERGR